MNGPHVCPCGSGRSLAECCRPLLEGAKAETAEALMRSRYTAHVVKNLDYIIATHDSRTREQIDLPAVKRWAGESQWLSLAILATERGGAADESGIVEFKATYRLSGVIQVHHERSNFIRQDGNWVYVDGKTIATPARRASDVGRNDPCPCGSGKKSKKCCAA